MTHSHDPIPRSWLIRAFLVGLSVFLCSATATFWMAQYIWERSRSDLRHAVELDSTELAQRIELGLSKRATVLNQFVSFWMFNSLVNPEEFAGFGQRMLGGSNLFEYVDISTNKFRIDLLEPSSRYGDLVGQELVSRPNAYLSKDSEGTPEAIIFGKLHEIPGGLRVFSMQARITLKDGTPGVVTAAIDVEELIRQALPADGHALRKFTLREAEGQRAFIHSSATSPGAAAITHRSIFEYNNLRWQLVVWDYLNRQSVWSRPEILVVILGLVVSISLGSGVGSRWLAHRRIEDSETRLRVHTAALERTNIRLAEANSTKEEAIAELKSANERLESTNVKLEIVNRDLGAANIRLRQLNKELDDFTHVVSHDLKEPLRGIQAFSQFLLEDYGDKLDELGTSYLETLRTSASRMQQLINDLMQLARVTKSRNSHGSVELGPVIERVLADLAFTIQSSGAEVVVQENLPTIWGDPIHLQVMFKNLISNGIRYNKSEPPRIEILWELQEPFVRVEVADNGLGIDPKYHVRIFELFERLVTQEEYEGTGAGLAICKKVAEQHGGTIWIESMVGGGSRFMVTLPIHPGIALKRGNTSPIRKA